MQKCEASKVFTFNKVSRHGFTVLINFNSMSPDRDSSACSLLLALQIK